MKKTFIVHNATITDKGNTTLTLKGGAKPFLFGGIQQSNAKGEFCWIPYQVMSLIPILLGQKSTTYLSRLTLTKTQANLS